MEEEKLMKNLSYTHDALPGEVVWVGEAQEQLRVLQHGQGCWVMPYNWALV